MEKRYKREMKNKKGREKTEAGKRGRWWRRNRRWRGERMIQDKPLHFFVYLNMQNTILI